MKWHIQRKEMRQEREPRARSRVVLNHKTQFGYALKERPRATLASWCETWDRAARMTPGLFPLHPWTVMPFVKMVNLACLEWKWKGAFSHGKFEIPIRHNPRVKRSLGWRYKLRSHKHKDRIESHEGRQKSFKKWVNREEVWGLNFVATLTFIKWREHLANKTEAWSVMQKKSSCGWYTGSQAPLLPQI